MIETAAIAFTTFFATIAPIDAAAIFAALTVDNSRRERWIFAVRGTIIAAIILLVFAIVGEALLHRLGISLAALRTAGGVLLMLMGIDMVFGRSSGAVSTTRAEQEEAEQRQDISVFPLATPLLAGPGTMGAVILLTANTQGHLEQRLVVISMLLAVLLIAFVALLSSMQIQRLLGITGLRVVSRVFGVLLCSLAVQFIFDGIRASGLFSA